MQPGHGMSRRCIDKGVAVTSRSTYAIQFLPQKAPTGSTFNGKKKWVGKRHPTLSDQASDLLTHSLTPPRNQDIQSVGTQLVIR